MLVVLAVLVSLARARVVWTFNATSAIYASPTIDPKTGDIFIASSSPGKVFGLSFNGSQKFTFSIGAKKDCDGNVAVHPDGRQLIFGCYDGYVYSIDRSGKLLWKFVTTRNVMVFSSPTIDAKGNIFVGSENRYLYKLSASGQLLWRFETGGAVQVTPRLSPDESVVVFGSYDRTVYALDAGDGTVRWRFQTDAKLYGLGARFAFDSIYMTSRDGTLHRFSLDGRQLWTFKVAIGNGFELDTRPAVDAKGNCIFGSSDKFIYSVSPSGTQNWNMSTNGPIGCSAAIDRQGVYYIGSDDSFLYALDPSGSVLWTFRAGGGIFSSPLLDEQRNRLYFGAFDGVLYALTIN